MKTRLLNCAGALLSIVTMGGALGARAQDVASGPERVAVNSDRFIVRGEVIARTEGGFTVLTRGSQLTNVQVSRDTSIVKGAQTIAVTEITVGDRVSVTLRRVADGSLQAVNVSVRTGFEPEL